MLKCNLKLLKLHCFYKIFCSIYKLWIIPYIIKASLCLTSEWMKSILWCITQTLVGVLFFFIMISRSFLNLLFLPLLQLFNNLVYSRIQNGTPRLHRKLMQAYCIVWLNVMPLIFSWQTSVERCGFILHRFLNLPVGQLSSLKGRWKHSDLLAWGTRVATGPKQINELLCK